MSHVAEPDCALAAALSQCMNADALLQTLSAACARALQQPPPLCQPPSPPSLPLRIVQKAAEVRRRDEPKQNEAGTEEPLPAVYNTAEITMVEGRSARADLTATPEQEHTMVKEFVREARRRLESSEQPLHSLQHVKRRADKENHSLQVPDLDLRVANNTVQAAAVVRHPARPHARERESKISLTGGKQSGDEPVQSHLPQHRRQAAREHVHSGVGDRVSDAGCQTQFQNHTAPESVSQVISWLGKLKLPKRELARYEVVFRNNGVDGKQLVGLTDGRLKKMGMLNETHRRKVLAHILTFK